MISMKNVTKIYKGLKGTRIPAIKNLDLQIKKGETVGYIGTNGAGKSTTIKMLTGIIKPSSGNVQVAGFVPIDNRKKLAQKIGVVFGQRTQLIWDLPAQDSFEFHSKLYKIPPLLYKERLNRLLDDFQATKFVKKTVRQLSLGQRVTCDIILSLLHNPELLFLDEPTIGLDIFNKEKIRNQLKDLNRMYNTTIFLTSHDITDVEMICDRIVIMNSGEKIYDDSIQNLRNSYSNYIDVTVFLENKIDINFLENYAPFVKNYKENWIKFCFYKTDFSINSLISFFNSKRIIISDISIDSISLEEIIKKLAVR